MKQFFDQLNFMKSEKNTRKDFMKSLHHIKEEEIITSAARLLWRGTLKYLADNSYTLRNHSNVFCPLYIAAFVADF